MKVIIYGLYHNEKDFQLTIRPFDNGKTFEGVGYFNDYYYISCDRKLLREKAEELKGYWIEKRKKELEILEELKVKNKYTM